MASDISIIIPFLNEREGIENLLSTIENYYSKRKFEFDILLIDDGSTDGSADIIKNYKNLSFSCKLITLSKNFGSHAAIRAGFTHATGSFITCLPTDLQISFDTVEKLYETALTGNDIVFGVRKSNEIGIFEKMFSRFYAFLMQKYVNKNYPFKGIDTFMINAKVTNIANQNIESNSSIILQLLTMGFKNTFIDIHKIERKIGKSKWTISKKVKLMLDSFIAFSYAPIRFVTVMGIIFSMVGFIWTAYIILRTILVGDLASGWPALVSVLLIGFGITNISLGIIAEYLWRTLDSSRKRPVFIIDEVIEI